MKIIPFLQGFFISVFRSALGVVAGALVCIKHTALPCA